MSDHEIFLRLVDNREESSIVTAGTSKKESVAFENLLKIMKVNNNHNKMIIADEKMYLLLFGRLFLRVRSISRRVPRAMVLITRNPQKDPQAGM